MSPARVGRPLSGAPWCGNNTSVSYRHSPSAARPPSPVQEGHPEASSYGPHPSGAKAAAGVVRASRRAAWLRSRAMRVGSQEQAVGRGGSWAV